jgi:hypothetical protein
LPFKCNLQRYSVVPYLGAVTMKPSDTNRETSTLTQRDGAPLTAVGLCTLESS